MFRSVLPMFGYQHMLQRDGRSTQDEPIRLSDLSPYLRPPRLFGCVYRPADRGIPSPQRGGLAGSRIKQVKEFLWVVMSRPSFTVHEARGGRGAGSTLIPSRCSAPYMKSLVVTFLLNVNVSETCRTRIPGNSSPAEK